MSKKVTFIGCGNMATAMIAGMLESGKVAASDLMATAKTKETCEKKAKEFGIQTLTDNAQAVKESDVIVLAVKPQFYQDVITEIKEVMKENALVISIAPGKTLEWFEEVFGRKVKLIRCMPNTPAMVGEGMMGICANDLVSQDEINWWIDLCRGFSKAEVVPERLMDVVTAVSGSSPAYVCLFIEAMADAAVAGGMPRSQAYTFAAQAVLGSAKMVLETGKHPGELKDMVCSPAGTTIQAVRVLEQKGLRSAVIEAMETCLDISRNM